MSTKTSNLDEFLTVAEVAELLKLNQQTVRNWIDQGSLPAHRVGRRVRIRRSDLERMLDQGYTVRGVAQSGSGESGPSAEDFWGGEPVGALADPWDGEPSVAPDGEASVAPDGEASVAPDGEASVAPDGEPSVAPDGEPSVARDGHASGAPSVP